MTAPPAAGKPSQRPIAGQGTIPERTKPQIARWLGIAMGAEQQFRDALLLISSRHESDAQMRDMPRTLAGWAESHLALLATLERRFGSLPSEHPERLRSALFYGTRVGAMGLLQDVQDLHVLAQHVRSSWTILAQVGDDLHDAGIVTVADEAGRETDRAIAWLEEQLKSVAPQAIAVPMDAAATLRTSLPPTPRIASVPDAIWAPAAGAGLILLAGAVGLALGRPILLASLGPTAYLQSDNPAHPGSRLWNVLVGHAAGFAAALVALTLVGAWDAPAPLAEHVLVAPRVAAAVVAIALTILLAALARASHPPAAATALLIALGALKTQDDFVNLAIGVAVVGVAGELVRRMRLTGLSPAEPRGSTTALESLTRTERAQS